jgi:hypothetical protein
MGERREGGREGGNSDLHSHSPPLPKSSEDKEGMPCLWALPGNTNFLISSISFHTVRTLFNKLHRMPKLYLNSIRIIKTHTIHIWLFTSQTGTVTFILGIKNPHKMSLSHE